MKATQYCVTDREKRFHPFGIAALLPKDDARIQAEIDLIQVSPTKHVFFKALDLFKQKMSTRRGLTNQIPRVSYFRAVRNLEFQSLDSLLDTVHSLRAIKINVDDDEPGQ
jgi:hypothetical protein